MYILAFLMSVCTDRFVPLICFSEEEWPRVFFTLVCTSKSSYFLCLNRRVFYKCIYLEVLRCWCFDLVMCWGCKCFFCILSSTKAAIMTCFSYHILNFKCYFAVFWVKLNWSIITQACCLKLTHVVKFGSLGSHNKSMVACGNEL